MCRFLTREIRRSHPITAKKNKTVSLGDDFHPCLSSIHFHLYLSICISPSIFSSISPSATFPSFCPSVFPPYFHLYFPFHLPLSPPPKLQKTSKNTLVHLPSPASSVSTLGRCSSRTCAAADSRARMVSCSFSISDSSDPWPSGAMVADD